MNIYFSHSFQRFFGVDINCTHCNQKINDVALLHYCWLKKNSRVELFCRHCFKKLVKNGIVDEYYHITITKSQALPTDARPFIHQRRELKDVKATTVFDTSSIEAEKTINKTKYSNRVGYTWGDITDETPVQIGNKQQEDRKAYNNLDVFFLEQKKALPIKPNSKKQISQKNSKVIEVSL